MPLIIAENLVMVTVSLSTLEKHLYFYRDLLQYNVYFAIIGLSRYIIKYDYHWHNNGLPCRHRP